MPASGENIGEEGKGRFMFGTGREGKGVEISIGDTEVLCLRPRVINTESGQEYRGTRSEHCLPVHLYTAP